MISTLKTLPLVVVATIMTLSFMTMPKTVQCLTPNAESSRRNFLTRAVVAPLAIALSSTTATSIIAPSTAANALDMDAFANQQLTASSSKTEMSEDEALCRFGYPSKSTGEACLRAGLSTKRKAGNSLNAFGEVDRGDFVRCKQFYADNGRGGYEKKTTCDDGSR